MCRHARKLLDDARKLEVELDAFAQGRGGTIRFLSNTNMLSEHMPQLIGTFLRDHPDVFVSVKDRPSLEVVNLLRAGEADMGIVASSADMTGLEKWRFVPDRLVVIVPRDFPLDGPLAYSSILDHPLVALDEKWRCRNSCDVWRMSSAGALPFACVWKVLRHCAVLSSAVRALVLSLKRRLCAIAAAWIFESCRLAKRGPSERSIFVSKPRSVAALWKGVADAPA